MNGTLETMQTNIIKIITYSHLDIYQWKRLHAALGRPQDKAFSIKKKCILMAAPLKINPLFYNGIFDGESEK